MLTCCSNMVCKKVQKPESMSPSLLTMSSRSVYPAHSNTARNLSLTTCQFSQSTRWSSSSTKGADVSILRHGVQDEGSLREANNIRNLLEPHVILQGFKALTSHPIPELAQNTPTHPSSCCPHKHWL